MDTLFPGLPANLTALTLEQLEGLLSQYQSAAKRIGDRDPELLGDRTMAQVLEEYQAGVEEIEKIREEMEARGETDKEFSDKLAQLTERAGIKSEGDEDGEDSDDGDEVQAVEESETSEVVAVEEAAAEPVAASAARFERRPAIPKPAGRHQPVGSKDGPAAFVASAGIPGIAEDRVLDKMELALAVKTKREQSTSTPKGVEEKVVVASVNYGANFPEERILRGDSQDQAKIDAVTSPVALTASGGLCAPVANYYEIENVSSSSRPVRDQAMAGFNASRGGLKFTQAISLAEIDDGVGIKTSTEDAAGGTTAEKSCQAVACPDFDEVELDMIYRCLQFGNLNSRAWPEMVAAFNDAALAAHARVAETALLDAMASYSTAVTSAKVYGAVSSLFYTILRTAAGMRSRHRLDDSHTLRAVLPGWADELLVADLVNSQFTRFEHTREGVVRLIRELCNVEVTFTPDGPTGAGQVFGAQGAGAVLDFPDTIVWFLYPEGSYLFLNGGSLDLGIVRDSTLNNTNDYRVFAETFEAVAFIGIESLKVTSTVCPTGETGPTATALTC